MKRSWFKPLAAGLLAAAGALAQTQDAPELLTGTLLKARETGSLTLGYRESSIPFSYRSARGEPIGYSIDLCKLLVDAIGAAVDRELTIRWQPVTSQTRIDAVVSGQVDLECGSTTNNLERQKQVAFSPTMFVSGTKLLVKNNSTIKSFRDLPGKTVVVTAGTTNEQTLRDLARKFKLDFTLRVAADHAASFELLTSGQVDAFATDDVLLYGLLAQNRRQGEFVVTGEFLSYDPYGIMFRRNDPQLASIVTATLHDLAASRELEQTYNKWFLRQLPTGQRLNLPMSAQLTEMIRIMGDDAATR